jgi:hypothetical protein
MQTGHRYAPQTRRYALDHARLQRHHRSSLLKTQWSLSGLLGAQIRTQGQMTHFLAVHPNYCKLLRGFFSPRRAAILVRYKNLDYS